MEKSPTTHADVLSEKAMGRYSSAALAWLRIPPVSEDTADLFALNDEGDFSLRCASALLSGAPFSLSVQAGHAASVKLNHFYFEARNRERVFGTRNFGVGYPMVKGSIDGADVFAPLFVYQLSLEPDLQHTDRWLMVQHEQHQVMPNFPLLHMIDQAIDTDLTRRAHQLTASSRPTPAQLQQFAERVQLLLEYPDQGLPGTIQPWPEHAAEKNGAGGMLWSAVAGIFPKLPRTTSTQDSAAIPQLPSEVEWKHPFTLLPLDPSQRTAMHLAQSNPLTVVQGASGTGKTYLLAAMAINALSNGKKCLVVSKSLQALRRAQKYLVDKGLGDLTFVLRDLQSDHLMLTDMLRATAENKKKHAFEEEAFKIALNQSLRELRKLDSAWEELHAPIFGEMNFTQLVGRFLQANRLEGKEMLLSQLNPADCAFTKEEFDGIIRAINKSRPLFERFPTLNHPLAKLNPTIFLDFESAPGLEWTRQQVSRLMDKATQINHRYIAKTNDYTEALLEHYEQHFSELSALVKRIRDAFEDGQQRFGVDFEKTSSVTEKLYGVFSDRYKQITQSKERLVEDFDALKKAYLHRRYFEFDIPANFDAKNIKKIAELTKDFEASLRIWRRRIPTLVREEVRRLNANSVHSDLDFREQVKELEYAMDVFLEEFNVAGLYDAPLRHEMLTIPKRQEFLEEVIARIEDTRFYLRDFPDFYIWQKHWLGLNPTEQKVVRALCKIKPNDWVKAFESWYLQHLLQNEYNPGLNWDADTIQQYHKAAGTLRPLLGEQITALWQNRKIRALRDLKSSDSQAYKTWFGKHNRNLAAEANVDALFRHHAYALTETLPVLLVTPDVALDVLQYAGLTYDLVLVDEAHNVARQEALHLFDMASNLVIFGDHHQDLTPMAKDDLLEFCTERGARNTTLEYQHQMAPEAWIQFNQTAFSTPFKRIPAGINAQDSTQVVNVGGRYDEQTQTNEAEALQIISWLNLVEQTPAKTYPVVGIACATIGQRDLIAGQLLRIRQRKSTGWEKIQQLHLNGLGVYQFAELQGQHVDVLMLSLTHGPIDTKGSLTKHLHFWNKPRGFNQIYVALTRTSNQMFIAHSIPPGLHTVLASDRNFIGTCVLSHLVTYADHLQKGDDDAARQQLEQMHMLMAGPAPVFPESEFMEEVCMALQPYYEEHQLQRNARVAGMMAPLAIQTTHLNVLLEDGVVAKSALPSYEWEDRLAQYLLRHNVDPVPAYAVSWWKSPRQAARRLAGKLLRTDAHATEMPVDPVT